MGAVVGCAVGTGVGNGVGGTGVGNGVGAFEGACVGTVVGVAVGLAVEHILSEVTVGGADWNSSRAHVVSGVHLWPPASGTLSQKPFLQPHV